MKTRREAEKYLERYIPKSLGQTFPAEHGLKRAALLLKLLGNPQEKYKSIHIAGTSGKGTTAYTTSALLTACGTRTGLHLSPHLEDIRERMMINGKFISDQKFISYLKEVLKAAEMCEKEFDKPTYFEILTALAFYTFAREGVEVAVIETGMGGVFDATNVIKGQDKIAVITRIGLDHTSILGKTLKEIATHKAGIIQEKNTVITLNSVRTNEVFQKRAREKSASIYLLGSANIKNVRILPAGIEFDFKFNRLQFSKLYVSLLGRHQVENVALALAAASFIQAKLTAQVARETLKSISFKGRLDKVTKDKKTIFIDGAHNEQKIRALTSALTNIYPDQKFTVILAIKKGKQVTDMLKLLRPITGTLIITTFFKDTHDLIHIAHDTDFLAQKARAQGFGKIITTSSAQEALNAALNLPNNYILTTGSLYYLQDIYNELEASGA